MLGAIIGDIVGSIYEFSGHKGKDIVMFTDRNRPTDDSFMTIAVADALVNCNGDYTNLSEQAIASMQAIGNNHPCTSWGERFINWLFFDPTPYNSLGNGAGMRVSPVAWVASSEEEVKSLSRAVTEISHNHPEGIKGAEAVAMATYLARMGKSKDELLERCAEYYPILKDKEFSIERLQLTYETEYSGKLVTCQGSVPQALQAFFESESFEDAILNAISIGGDSDTIAAMCGAVAEAYYGVSEEIENRALEYLSDDLLKIYHSFSLIKGKKASN